jgi:uncharacterized protein (DUF2344 family)
MANYIIKVFNEKNYQTTSKVFTDYEKALSKYEELKSIAKNTGKPFTVCLYGKRNNVETLYETETVNPTRIMKIN